MYPPLGWRSDWEYGGTSWTIDYPRADRHIVEMVRRLTVVDARSVEQPVNLDDEDDVFNWPWLYAVEVGTWDLSDEQVVKLREYLLRGGFLMVDDFHGTREWAIFMESMQRVFPDRPVVDIPDEDQIFHTFWDLDDRQQIPGAQFMYSGQTYERDGYTRALARHLRRRGPRDGRDLPQHGSRRRGRALRYAGLSRDVLGAGDAHVHQLHHLRDDALTATSRLAGSRDRSPSPTTISSLSASRRLSHAASATGR